MKNDKIVTTNNERVFDRERAMAAVKEFLLAIGEDPTREGLQETPRRVADMYAELLEGNQEEAKEHLQKTFSVAGSEIVVEKDIQFSSMCEHHLMPFFGKIAIAYIPDQKVVGLSKLARTVEVFARRLQIQEQLTEQIAEAVMQYLQPKGVMVYCAAQHTCMTCRGVKKMGSETVSYSVKGNFPQEKVSEVLQIVK
jgi:GTP cyclohydrolase I